LDRMKSASWECRSEVEKNKQIATMILNMIRKQIRKDLVL